MEEKATGSLTAFYPLTLIDCLDLFCGCGSCLYPVWFGVSQL